MPRTPLLALTLLLSALGLACDDSSRSQVVGSSSSGPVAPAGPHLQVLRAPDGEVGAAVRTELERARADGRRLLVYVGATWCEPCQRFHQAAESGTLDAKLPPMRFLEFDLDKDQGRLAAAGYQSKFIPLFALPQTDGRATPGKAIEGSVKGPGAPDEITPRLLSLLQ
ncbi:MAG: hypothetical protein NVS3B10_20670 [Polyangiales bacterium]